MRARLVTTFLSVLVVVSCGSPQPVPDGGTGGGSGGGSGGGTGGGGNEQPDAGPLADFPLRAPASRQVTCNASTMTFEDTDWYCRVPIGTASIDLYVQATPTGCTPLGLSSTPTFDTRAWFKVGGQGQAFPTSAKYVWGGNHHNDELRFLWNGGTYDLWHSSIGFGFRVCAPMDCAITCPAGTSLDLCDSLASGITNGCARASGGPPPPSRVWCAPVTSASLPALSDPWTSTPARLPCAGE